MVEAVARKKGLELDTSPLLDGGAAESPASGGGTRVRKVPTSGGGGGGRKKSESKASPPAANIKAMDSPNLYLPKKVSVF